MRELILSYGSHWSLLEFIYLDDMVYKGWIDSWFTFVHKGVLVIAKGCIGVSEKSLLIRLID